jgi:hypothetical protein
MEQYLPYILQGVGGAVLAPLITAIIGGKGLGFIGNAVLGIAGGVGVGYCAQAAGYGNLLGGDTNQTMSYVQHAVEGGVGGAVLGILLGILRR